jgi:hypothetical protein
MRLVSLTLTPGDSSQKFQFHVCQILTDQYYGCQKSVETAHAAFGLAFITIKTEGKGKKSFPREQGLW